MDGWNTTVSFWDGLFSGAILVLGSVSKDLAQHPIETTILGRKMFQEADK